MKPILRQAIEESGTPLKAVAEACGRPYSYMKDALNLHEPQQLTVADFANFMRATNLTPLRWLCREFDGTFTHLPVFPAGHEDIRDRFMTAVDEVGRDSAAIQRALADGQISDSEGRDVVAELENTIDVFRQVISLVQAKRARPARMTLPVEQSQRARA